jgi:DNA polymerase III subunit gamma/tau
MNIALKYRPDNFKDLVGQEVLVRILHNAFSMNRIPQSILLSGSSGIGKTTTARIIALCLNCTLGPTFEPCGSCTNCLAIKEARHPDVMEVDAASHTGIDDIKLILEDIRYSPISSKFKIYIVDEIHMLSNSAFNALLKTLEEPPSNVKFIFATTEIKKIPITIVARCQRFDLCNIPTTKIVERLKNIIEKEDYSVEPGVPELIARYSENSMRNALFLLNQVALYSKDNIISTVNIADVLGLVNRDIVFDLLQAVLDGDLQQAFIIFDKGSSVTDAVGIFEDLLRNIQSICRFLITKKHEDLITEYEANRIRELSVKKPITFLSRLWRVLLRGIQDVKTSTCNGVAIEIILVTLCHLSDLPAPEKVVKKLILQPQEQFDKILQLLKQNGQIYLYRQLCSNLQLIDCKPGYLALKAISEPDDNLRNNLKNCLDKITNYCWVITIDRCNIPAVKDILSTFKGAKIVNVENKE